MKGYKKPVTSKQFNYMPKTSKEVKKKEKGVVPGPSQYSISYGLTECQPKGGQYSKASAAFGLDRSQFLEQEKKRKVDSLKLEMEQLAIPDQSSFPTNPDHELVRPNFHKSSAILKKPVEKTKQYEQAKKKREEQELKNQELQTLREKAD